VNRSQAGTFQGPLEAVEHLVLRGDGLTTTSIETLTGREITVQLQGQRRTHRVGVGDDAEQSYAGLAFDADAPLAGAEELETVVGDDLLVRRVHLVDGGATVYAVGEVVAVLNRLPASLVDILLTTTVPLGKAMVAAGIGVTRQLRGWGPQRVGELAVPLGPNLAPDSTVPARTYRMVSVATGLPLNVITEWFSPRLFELAKRGGRPPMARPHKPGRASGGR
jgi:chorismate-pyruvate lyase